MGSRNIIKEFVGNVGWWLYWRAKWQENLEWKEKLSPHTTTGREIRDELAYFLVHGTDRLEAKDIKE